MPTARELLEQADALMRRNRSAAADDIPVLTEAVSPKPTFRVPLRPSPESPPPETAMAAEPDAADAIPTLTERVPAGGEPDSGAVLAEGEPSDWLDLDAGEPSVTGRAPDSVLGVPDVVTAAALRDAADAEDATPPVAEVIEITPAADADFESEMGGTRAEEVTVLPEYAAREALAPGAAEMTEATAADEPESDGEPALREAAGQGPGDAPAPATWAVTAWPETELPPEVEALPALAAEAELVFESPTSVSWNVEALLSGSPPEGATAASPAAETQATAFGAAPATEADEPALPAPAAGPDVAAPAPAAPPVPVSLAPSPAEAFLPAMAPEEAVAWPPPTLDPAPAAAPAPDDARWEAIAEEIRMQVLQRIDLFTDTGLREQLGLRLQPIVDRASADLVATINQHVGELLRAYVAEAIEREIERWRSSQ